MDDDEGVGGWVMMVIDKGRGLEGEGQGSRWNDKILKEIEGTPVVLKVQVSCL